MRDDSRLHQEGEDPVFHLPLFPTLQESFGFLQEDQRNPPKQGVFPQAESLDKKDKAALPPLGTSSYLQDVTPVSQTSFLQGRPVFLPSPLHYQNLSSSLKTRISLKMWGSKFLAAMIVEEASFPSPYCLGDGCQIHPTF